MSGRIVTMVKPVTDTLEGVAVFRVGGSQEQKDLRWCELSFNTQNQMVNNINYRKLIVVNL